MKMNFRATNIWIESIETTLVGLNALEVPRVGEGVNAYWFLAQRVGNFGIWYCCFEFFLPESWRGVEMRSGHTYCTCVASCMCKASTTQ